MINISDESAAKALLKGSVRNLSSELRSSMEDFSLKLKILMDIKAKSFRNKRLLTFFDKTYSHGSLLMLSYKFKGLPDRSRKIWLNIGLAQQTNFELKTVHLFPVSVTVIDFWQSRDIRGFDSLFYVSKHLLERVILRNQEVSLDIICLHLRPFASALAKAIIKMGYDNIPSDFVLLSSKGMVTCSNFNDDVNLRAVPILTTYIPFDMLGKSKTDSFGALFETCADDSCLTYFIDNETYQAVLKSKPKNHTYYFECNSGLCGDEAYPIMLSRQTISGFI